MTPEATDQHRQSVRWGLPLKDGGKLPRKTGGTGKAYGSARRMGKVTDVFWI